MKDRMRTWLMAHPGLLWVLFLLAAKGSKVVEEGVSTQSGASGTLGP
jgi:hypothetical protein